MPCILSRPLTLLRTAALRCASNLPVPKERPDALCALPSPSCSLEAHRAQRVDAEPKRFCLERTQLPESDPEVVVIGAGLAGLSAAAHLVQHGVGKVTVLEARDRPGGRVQSSFLGDAVIEFGAPWRTYRHVADNQVVRRAILDGFLPGTFSARPEVTAASPLRVAGVYPCNPMRADAARTLLVDEKGSPVASAVAMRAYDMARDIEEDTLAQADSGQADELVGHRVRLELQRVPAEHRDVTARIVVGLLSARRLRSPRDSAFLVHDHVCAHLELPGAAFRVPLGHVAAVEPLLRTLGPARVRYGKTVQTVRWGLVPGQQALVTCEDGEEHRADHIVVALPLGVLKQTHSTMFLPGLPCSKVRALEKLEVQAYNRVFLDYEKPFWAWLEGTRLERVAPEADGQGQDRGRRSRGSWLRGVTRLRTVQGSSHVLKLDVQGEAAFDAELCSDTQIVEDATRYLRQCTGQQDFPYPSSMVRSRWSTDPLSCGATTEYPRGEDGALLSRTLAEPVHGVIFFAGEATNHRYLSTVQGAVLSGVREADRVLERVETSRQESAFCRQRARCQEP